MRKLIAMLLVMLTLFSVIPAGVFASETDAVAPETSVENLAQFKKYAEVTAETQTLASGTDAELKTITLSDGDTVTKAQWIAKIVELFELEAHSVETADDYYPDVTKEHEYFNAINIATTNGLIYTPAGENFEPDSPASREFVAHTANELLGYQVIQETDTVVYSFTDTTPRTEVTDETTGEVTVTGNFERDLQVAVDRGWFALSGTNVNPSQAVNTAEATKVEEDIKAYLEDSKISEENISNVTFKDGVKVIDVYSNVIQLDMGHLQFTDLDTNTLAVGDTIAVFVGPIPSIIKVESITSEGLITDVKGQALPLDEGVDMETLHLEGTSEISLESFRPEEGDNVVYVFEDGYETASATYARARALQDKVKVRNIEIGNIKKQIITGITAEFTGGTKNVWFSYKISFKEVYINVKGDVKADGNKLLGVDRSIPVGSVFVPGVGPINLYAVIGLDGELIFTFDSGFESTIKANKDDLSFTATLIRPEGTAHAKIDAKVGLKLEYKLELLSVIKGSAWAEGGMKAGYHLRTRKESEREEFNTNVKVCEGFERYVYAEVGYDLKVGFKAGKFDVSAYSKSDQYDIFTREDKVGYQMYHWEDGIARMSCTFEDFEKYFTKYGGSNGFIFPSWISNRGYGSGGQIIQVFEYELDDSGFATITGFNYTTSLLNIPSEIEGHKVVGVADGVFRGKKNIQVIKIPEGITKIGEDTFNGCTKLYSVQFPSTLTHIGRYAFFDCKNLVTVNLPKNLRTMGQYAFGNCTSLSWVYIPKSLELVSMYSGLGGAFSGCSALRTVVFEEGTTIVAPYLFGGSGLREITIPDTVKSIGDHAFYGCEKLHTVNFGSSLTTIDDNAFRECISLGELIFPSSLTTIGEDVFYGCEGLYNVQLNENLTKIGRYAFCECTGLTEVILPKTLKTVGQYAFRNCTGVEKVFIPKGLGEVPLHSGGGGPFSGCSALKTVEFEEGITNIPGRLFAECTGLEEITIPEYVTTVNYAAFYHCTNLTKINFPESLTTIGEDAFMENTKLKEVTFPSKLTSIGADAFNACPILEKVTFNEGLTDIGRYAFYNCDLLREAILPKTLRDIGQYAFGKCDNLEKVFIPKSLGAVRLHSGIGGPFAECGKLNNVEFEEGIEAVAERLFAACDGITTMTVPATVKSIDAYAFNSCINLTSITLPEGLENIRDNAFEKCTKLEKLEIPATVKSIGSYAFGQSEVLREVTFKGNLLTTLNNGIFYKCIALEKIAIPEGVTYIRDSAFSGCRALKEVTFPDSLTEIDRSVFENCTSLTGIVLPEGLQVIDSHVFKNCDSITTITVPDTVHTLGNYSFEDCDALESITLSDKLTVLGAGTFLGCDKLRTVNFGKNITTIEQYAMKDCPALDNVVVPKGVTSVAREAFKNDTGLKTITLPQTVNNIDSTAFSYKMTVYGPKGSYAETWANANGHTFIDNTNNIVGIAPVDDKGELTDVITVYRGETFSPEYMIIASDDTKEATDTLSYSFSSTGVSVSGSQLYANYAGDVTVTVTPVGADGKATTDAATYTIRVIELSSIKVTPPAKTSYAYGEELDLTGMVVKAVYSDGSEKDVSDYEVTGYDKNTYGPQTITVKFGGKNAAFTVNVIDDRLLVTSIAVTNPPNKVQYLLQEKLDIIGIVVTATYSDNTTAVVTGDKLKFSTPNSLTAGEKTITVTYIGTDIEDGSVITTTFTVTYYKQLPTEGDAKVSEIINAINEFCTADLTLADGEKIMNIKNDYDALEDALKSQVTNYSKLEDALHRLDQLTIAAGLETEINELYEKYYIDPNDISEDDVNALREKYDSLDNEYKRRVPNYNLLEKMLGYYENIVSLLIADINDLYDIYKSASYDELLMYEGEIYSVKSVYDAQTAERKAQVTNYARLEEMIRALEEGPETPSVLLGDVTGDGKINALDATQILRFANNKSSVLTGCKKGDALFVAADVTNDGKINALDATQILRYANNKSSVLKK